jgi:beta-glucosidase
VVLMKNHDGTLPLRRDWLAGKRVYVELFESDLRVAKLDGLRADLAAAHPDISFTTDYGNADVAVVFLNPFSGDYFQSTGLLDLEFTRPPTSIWRRSNRSALPCRSW